MSSKFKSIKPPKAFSSYEKENQLASKYTLSHNLLYKKYSNKEFNYTYINTNYLIFNEKSRIVSIFKDYLIYDDSTEFLNNYYSKEEIKERLNKIFNFYSTYSKIFPNYIILSENLYLYRNIRRKQKMINAFNEIKKEEEENRKKLQLGLSNKKKINYYKIFDKSTQESINRYQPSITNTFKNSFDESKSTLSISLYNNKLNFIQSDLFKEDNNTTLNSFESLVIKLDNKYNNINKLQKDLISTPKRDTSNNKNSHYYQQTTLNNNKTFISHKTTISLNDKNQNFIKNLIIEKKINNNNSIFNGKKSPSPKIKSNRENIKENHLLNSRKNSNKKNHNFFMKEIHNSEYKSPVSKDLNLNNKNIKRPITTTIKTINHMMPFYKNKFIECDKNSNNNNHNISNSINNFSTFVNKVNPIKTKLEKKKNSNNVKKHNTLNSFSNTNKKSFISSFTSNNKEIKKNKFIEGNSNKLNNSHQKENSNIIIAGNENNKNINCKEMKDKYKNIIEKNKIIRNSYDPQTHFFDKFHSHNSLSINNNKNKNINLKSQRKRKVVKNSLEKKNNIMTPNIRIPLTVLQSKIKNYNNNNNKVYTPVNKNLKLNLNLKDKKLDKINTKNLIKKINLQVFDANTKKMKFIKK
jgi:hypothetical protein